MSLSNTFKKLIHIGLRNSNPIRKHPQIHSIILNNKSSNFYNLNG